MRQRAFSQTYVGVMLPSAYRRVALGWALMAFVSIADLGHATTYTVTVGPGLSYSPSALTIVVGDSVQFHFVGGTHGVQHGDGACTPANPSLFSFTSDGTYTFTQAGTYPFYCPISNHCALGEKGTITVAIPILLPGRVTVIKPGTLVKFVAKPVAGDTFSLPSGDPVSAGGSLRVFDLATTAGDDTYTLPAGTPPLGWKGLGTPAGAKGFKYKGAGTLSDPCKVVVIKATVIKGVCKGTGITLSPPFTGDVGIVLSVGATDRYCAQFDDSDEVKNEATITKRKNAPAPGACP